MTNIIKSVLLLFTILGVLKLNAQEEWSLNRCIQYALENNLKQQSFDLGEQTAKVNTVQSQLNLLPSITANSSVGINFGRSVDQYTYDIVNTKFINGNAGIRSQLSIFHGFIYQNMIAYNKFKEKSARWQKVNNQDDLAFAIISNYYDIIYFKGMVEIANEQLDLSEFNLRKTEAQIETGLKAKTDLAEMQSSFEKEKLNLLNSENNLAEAKLKLGQQMNMPATHLVSIISKNVEPVASSNLTLATDSLFENYAQNSPYVKIAQSELDAAKKDISISRGNYFPSISLNASVNTAYFETNRDADGKTIPISNQLDNNMSQYIGASISIPIFTNNQKRFGVTKAKIERLKAQNRLDTYKQEIYFEVMNNHRELNALFTKYYQIQKQLDADELSYKVAERKYEEGLIDVIQLLTVKQRLAETKSQLLQARLQWEIKEKVIDFYKGIRFWE